MTLPNTTVDALRAELITGIRASNRRRNRRRMAAAVPLLAVVGGIGLSMRGVGDTPAYAMSQQPDGTVRVQVFPDFDDVDDLRSSLRDLGLNASIVRLLAHPSLDGVVEVVSHENENTAAFEFNGGEFVIDTAAASGEIEILIYVGVDEGEDYQASPSVFAPGQELAGLHCAYDDRPLPTDEFAERVSAVGDFEVTWTIFGETDAETGTIDFEDFDERPDGVVSGASLRSSNSMQVFVDPSNSEPAAEHIGMYDGTHYRDVPVCTPDLAGAWD